MQQSYWERVVAEGCRLPQGAALDELTIELVSMLGETDPHVRTDIAHSVLQTWIGEGIYDELLVGLGDGLVLGLRKGIGEDRTPSVLRRSYSAAVLAEVIARDNVTHGLHPAAVLTWADQAVAWMLAERDLRGWIPAQGWASPMTHAADVLGALSASRHLGADELPVLLDVLAERLSTATTYRFTAGEEQRLAFATMSLLHRDLIPIETLEGWLERLTAVWADADPTPDPGAAARENAVDYLRALHLQLLLGVHGTPAQNVATTASIMPGVRSDLLIALQRALRSSAPWMYRQP
ncbi:uncharacterized protein DUF2785 [Haloactinopolyspora alba]|uniref:Uncharacterized protein DUF2785 n=1 Tax=Haloactinopolyspora alba TaxID=648780 RepID=A0A2P8EB14_9ACTN|nr:DUF2785 domain-containing protein [Haloactinopolyspora alba]PSL06659.1 uncharacterized protein DUF2785 [Haloactinopolyspora alba]